MRYFMVSFFCFVCTVAVVAQASCSAFVNNVLMTLGNTCEAINRNELCYGNEQVAVTTLSGADPNFNQPGDITSIVDIASIQTSPFAEPDEWGVALMRVQANIPDSLPGQNVTVLLFGAVNLTNHDSHSNSLVAGTTNNIDIHSGPSVRQTIIGRLQRNTEIELTGRNAAGDWVFFLNEDTSGWLFASLLQIDGDVMTLNEVSDDFDGEPSVAPMQAVYVSTGIGQSTCSEIPKDGVLIQSPEYDEPIELVINDVEIRFGSTVYLQAQAGGVMRVYVVEGVAIVTANAETVIVPAGAMITVLLDDELHAISTPSLIEPYNVENVESAPVSLMEETIEIAEPVSADNLTGHTIVVGSNSDWVDSGIQVASGQTLIFAASGEVNVWPNCETESVGVPEFAGLDCGSLTFGPNGGEPIINGELVGFEPSANSKLPAPQIIDHSLVGRIGNSEPFLVGEYLTLVSPSDGTLYLRLNDSDYNNSGEFVVNILKLD